MLRFTFSLLVLLQLMLVSERAHACASCGFNDASNVYFLKMVIFMTVLPVLVAGSGIYYVVSRSRKNRP